MTAAAISGPVDRSGLNGQRIARSVANAPDILEVWQYPAYLGFDAIEAAWKSAPRVGRSLVLCVTPYKQSAGRLLVNVRLYEEAVPGPPHIEEPTV